jgi:hypothetical protein
LFCLLSAVPSSADSLQATFSVSVDLFLNTETVSGSFLWNTQTEVISNVSLFCTGPFTFLPIVQSVLFAPPGNSYNYPAGSLIFLDFQDASHTINFQINFGDHGYLDSPIVAGSGVYNHVPFDIGGAGIGNNPGIGEVIVTAAPEPAGAFLLGCGILAIGAVVVLKKFRL